MTEEINLEQLKQKRMAVLDVADQDIVDKTVKAVRIHLKAIADLTGQEVMDTDAIAIHREAVEYLTTPITLEYINLARLQVAIENMEHTAAESSKKEKDMICFTNRSEHL